MTAPFPPSRWVLVELTTDGVVTRYGVSWLRTYRGTVPILAKNQMPTSRGVPLFAAQGQIISAHTHRETPAVRATVLNRDLAPTREQVA